MAQGQGPGRQAGCPAWQENKEGLCMLGREQTAPGKPGMYPVETAAILETLLRGKQGIIEAAPLLTNFKEKKIIKGAGFCVLGKLRYTPQPSFPEGQRPG